MTKRLSTGSEVLDRQLEGGIPPGTLVALTAPPDTQSELFLQALAGERQTIYLSPVRPADEVTETLDLPHSKLSVLQKEPETILTEPEESFKETDAHSNIIIDPMNGFETGQRRRYIDFLNTLKEHLRTTESVALLHCIDAESNPSLRSLTLNRADLVWRLQLTVTTLTVDTRLIISKFRDGKALRKPIKLRLTDSVQIDTSRDIA